MQTIIPYQESVFSGTGAIITPVGDIISIYTLHEVFAKNYCNGEDYDYLKYMKYYASKKDFHEFQKNRHFQGDRQDLDEWCHSKLNLIDLERYKIWLKQYQRYFRAASALDYLILSLNFDKIETITSNTITTTSKTPHIRFFNYYLMDWNVQVLSKAYFNEERNLFEFHSQDLVDVYHSYSMDLEAEEEILNIKKKVKKKEIPYFFR